jgi:hypothetical protein
LIRSCAEVAALSTAERGLRKLKQLRTDPTPRERFDVLASELLARNERDAGTHVRELELEANKTRPREAQVAAVTGKDTRPRRVEGVPPVLNLPAQPGMEDTRALNAHCKGCGRHGHSLFAIRVDEIQPNCPAFAKAPAAIREGVKVADRCPP